MKLKKGNLFELIKIVNFYRYNFLAKLHQLDRIPWYIDSQYFVHVQWWVDWQWQDRYSHLQSTSQTQSQL